MNPYAVLGIGENSPITNDVVDAAYRAAVLRFPPDRDPEQFQRIRSAYDILRDETARSRLRIFGGPRVSSFVDLAPDEAKTLPVLNLETWSALLKERKD